MLKRPLGKTGWNVSVISFGAWNIGGQWGDVPEDVAIKTIQTAGVNFLDTARARICPK